MKFRLILITGILAFFSLTAKAQCSAYGYYSQSGATVIFYDSSYSANGHFTEWWFGDGTSQGYGTQVPHTFAANGTYNACLAIYDSVANCNDTTCFTIIVSSYSNCNASFTQSVDATNSLKYYFYGSTPPTGGSAQFIISDYGSNATTYNTQNATHTFPNIANRFYLALYILKDSSGQMCDSVSTQIYINSGGSSGGGSNCDASFNVYGSSYLVNFIDTITSGAIFEYRFGDGTYGYTQDPQHSYSSPGTYNACLYIYDVDSVGDTSVCDSFCQTITISCNANFSVTADSTNPQTYHFTNLSFGESSVLWKFTSTDTTSVENPSFTFTTTGQHIVTLYTYDAAGNLCDSSYRYISIQGAYPDYCNASFYTYVNQNQAKVWFYDSTITNTIIEYHFGDGTIGYTHDPYHVYSGTGPYTACLYVYGIDSVGDTVLCDSSCQTFTFSCNAAFSYTVDNSNPYKLNFNNTSTGAVTANWLFDGGNSSNTYNPSFTFATAGYHSVCLTTYDSSNNFCDSICKTVWVPGNNSWCNASFTYLIDSINQSANSYPVDFTNTSQSGFGQYWEFGDGDTSTALNPTHVYNSGGNFTTCLYTLDSLGYICDTFCTTITLSTPPCNSSFSYIVDSTNSNRYYFTGSNPPSGGWASWEVFEGTAGGSTNYSGTSATHTFTGSGTPIEVYYYTYKADSTLCDVDTAFITLSGSGCSASYYLGVDTSNIYNLYIITTSTGTTSNTNYLWDFGDGSTSTSQYPSHQYASFGLYELCLTISDTATGCYSTYCDSIGLDSNGNLLKKDGFGISVVNEDDFLDVPTIDVIQDLKLYPNPSRGLFTLELSVNSTEDLTMRALNVMGQVILTNEFTAVTGSNEFKIDMTGQPDGMYFISLKSGNQVKNLRVYLHR